MGRKWGTTFGRCYMKNVFKSGRYKSIITLGAAALLISSASMVSNAAEDEELLSMVETNPQVKLLREGEYPDLISYENPYAELLTNEDATDNWQATLVELYSSGLNNGLMEIDISNLNIPPANSGEVFSIIRDTLNRNPQLFYARADVRIWYTSTRIVKIDNLYADEYVKNDGSIDIPLLSRDKVRFMDRVNDALSNVSADMSQMEKVLAIHDWIVRECDYDIINYQQNTIPSISYTARGVFLEGKAVCAGYSEAMAMLLNSSGIDTVTVSSESMNHAWNIVKLGNDYYHIDATWDDPVWTGYNQYKDQVNEGYTSHEYFLRSDTEMINQYRHYGWNEAAAPDCNVSGSYATAPFRTYSSTNYTNYLGKWYYTVGDYVCRSDIAGGNSEWKKVTETETSGSVTLLNAFVKDGALYYSTANNVFKLDSIQSGTFDLSQAYSVYRVGQQHAGYHILEFSLKQGEIHVNGTNNTNFFEDRLPLESSTLNGWVIMDGVEYWYENGVRQGYDPNDAAYRGKEIYDPGSNEWYWLDNVQKGAKAVSKDVFQESQANGSGKIGKWVRYDANGHMIKGWDYKDGKTYYFDLTYGTMLKGVQFIDGEVYYFDEMTGALSRQTSRPQNGWWISGGETYWYQNGVRQGYDPNNSAYRGMEIYDENTDAWYWLDNAQNGARAKSRDVYQESDAGPWATDLATGTGKWVRYDADGHMVKGWNQKDGNTYYYDLIYGTMARGSVVIDGQNYYFNPNTGALE